jgi:hypothetical protein
MNLRKWGINAKENIAVAAVVGMLALAGCHSEERFRPEYLADESRLVGGGVKIEWQAPESGTVYLVEERTGKLVQTVTLAEGETYKFSVESVVDADDLETLLGIDIDRAQFLLYFKPFRGEVSPARADKPAKK